MALQAFVALFAVQRNSPTKNREYIITAENLKQNTPKGTFLGTKSNENTRIWSTNINGLSYDNMGGKMVEVASLIQEVSADIMACVEINTDTTRYDVKSTMFAACKNLSTPQMVCSSTPIRAQTHFKPGGTVLVCSGPITS